MLHNAGQALRYDDSWDRAVSGYRNRTFAIKSWHRHKHQYCNEPCLSDFAEGFRQGYLDVANGGNGCTPAFPPREYWSWQFQSAYGQKRVSAWFAGYPHGARAAEEEGLGNWSQIQMSSGLQAEYVKAGVLPNRPNAVYPITETLPAPAGVAPGPINLPPTPRMMPSQPAGGLPVPDPNTMLPDSRTPEFQAPYYGAPTPVETLPGAGSGQAMSNSGQSLIPAAFVPPALPASPSH